MPVHKKVANRPYKVSIYDKGKMWDFKRFATWEAALSQGEYWRRLHPEDAIQFEYTDGVLTEEQLEEIKKLK